MADCLALKLDTDVLALQSEKLVRMRVLAVTNMFPNAESPAGGTFVEQQVKSLRTAGLDVDVANALGMS